MALLQLLDIKEVARSVRLSQAAIWRWVQQGKFPRPLKLSGRATRWRTDHVEAWIEHVTAGNPPTWPVPGASEPAATPPTVARRPAA